jgi:hypothetical protein
MPERDQARAWGWILRIGELTGTSFTGCRLYLERDRPRLMIDVATYPPAPILRLHTRERLRPGGTGLEALG